MSTHSLLRAVAACAAGKRVMVSVPSGKVYALPIVLAPALPEPPHPLEAVAKQLLESDAVGRALVEAASKNFSEVFARVDDSLADVAAGQVEIVQGVRELEGTLHLPVKPVYDPAGKLIGAQRVKKLGATK